MATIDFSNRRGAAPIRVFLDSDRAERSIFYPELYRFNVHIDARLDMHDVFMQIRRIQCSYTWYNILAGENTLYLGGTVVTIDPGNYNIYEMVSVLNKQSWAVSTVWSWNAATGKLQISCDSSVGWDADSNLATRLGFLNVTSKPPSANFIADQLPDMSRVKCLNFHVQSLSSQSFAVYENFDGFQLAATIFVDNAAPYTALTTTDETLFAESSMESYIQSIVMRILDQDGNPVDLQNGSFQIIAEFSFYPKRNFRLEI